MSPYRVIDPTDVLWRRAGAFTLDVAQTFVIGLVVGVLFGWLFGTWIGALSFLLGGLGWWLFISIGIQGNSGATPGKLLAGLRVVDATGRAANRGQIAARTLLWPLDGFPYVLPATAFASSMSSRSGQRVGDRVAKTWVVDKQFVGLPPVAVALPRDPDSGLEPYELRTHGDYLPAGMTIPELKAMRHHAGQVAINAGTVAPGGTSIGTGQEPHDSFELPANPAEPRWDANQGAYVRYNAVQRHWMVYDETRREWVSPIAA